MGKFTHDEEQLLKLYQSEQNRRGEEEFARIFTERDNVRVAFINEDRAFTDGRNIVIDPAMDKLFADGNAVERTLEFLGLPKNSCSSWDVLKLTTRSQDIHECLHIIYTKFPPPSAADERSKTKSRLLTLSMIGNIMEDAYIENVGASVYDNAKLFLKWGRVSRLFVSYPSEGTFSRNLSEADVDTSNAAKLMYVINYMTMELLYPMVEKCASIEECAGYIEQIKPLYMTGSVASAPMERHRYACMIFDIIEPLIPESEELLDFSYLDGILGGTETHSPLRCSAKPYVSEGREQEVTRRLFTDSDGNPDEGEDISEQYMLFVSEAEGEYQIAVAETMTDGQLILINGCDVGASAMHGGITIYENHPKPNRNFAKAYANILKKYRTAINTYNSRFEQLLRADREFYEDKQLFGNGISSKNMGDVKKRYWYRKSVDTGVPELSVLFMVDGSGSMQGERRGAAMTSLVILHEVLAKQGIEHSIVEHRAIFGEAEVRHNVLVNFCGRESEKYNIMLLDADEGTREGLSLFWAERYLAQKSSAEKKLIVVISDGVPAHECDGIPYYPPVSVMDTRNAGKKIIRRGTKIIALALGGERSGCYEELKEIYSEVIDCTNLKGLTGQLLKVISREFK